MGFLVASLNTTLIPYLLIYVDTNIFADFDCFVKYI